MNSSSRLPLRFAYLLGCSVLSIGALFSIGCTEEGHSPDCPDEDYLNDDGSVDETKFDTWREAMEDAGCITPIGGTWKNGGASADDQGGAKGQ